MQLTLGFAVELRIFFVGLIVVLNYPLHVVDGQVLFGDRARFE